MTLKITYNTQSILQWKTQSIYHVISGSNDKTTGPRTVVEGLNRVWAVCGTDELH